MEIKEKQGTVVRIQILIPKCTNFESMSLKAIGIFFSLQKNVRESKQGIRG